MRRILKIDKEAYIQKIISMNKEGLSQDEIGKRFGKSGSAIQAILKRNGFSVRKNSRGQYGSANPSFKGGLSRATISRATKEALIIAKRNLHICERCGIYRELPLGRHHKDRDRSNNEESNIEVLCPACHNKEHMSERLRDINTGQFYG